MQGKIKLDIEELAIDSFETAPMAAVSDTRWTECLFYTNCLGSCEVSCKPTECGACTYTGCGGC